MNSSTPYFLNRELQNIARDMNRSGTMSNVTLALSCITIALIVWQEWAKAEEKKQKC